MPAIIFERKGPIAYITLNRPEVLNALNSQLRQDIMEAFMEVRDDDAIRAAIVTGAGERAFSTGADLKEIAERAASGAPLVSSLPPYRDLELWKPLIAAVNGLALGGGCELALLCDIRIAAEHAQFGVTEVKRALIPGSGGTQRLPRLLPFGIALDMLLTGDPISAPEAHRLGLVSKVVPFKELMTTAEDYARRIAENGPLAVRYTKMAAYRGRNMSLAEGLALESYLFDLTADSDDAKEGPKAFTEKRKPEYKGR